MRRNDREITDRDQMLAIMDGCASLCLAMKDPASEVPYLVALNYGVESDDTKIDLYIHSALEGKKVLLLQTGTKVRFFLHRGHDLVYDEVKCSCTMNYESVSGIAQVEEMVDRDEKRHGLDVLMAHYYPRETPPYDEKVIQMTRVYRLRVESISAKKREKKR